MLGKKANKAISKLLEDGMWQEGFYSKELLEAKRTIDEIIRRAENDAAAAPKQNPGKPDKRGFVLTLAQAWTFLVGAPPSAVSSSKDSHFIAFLKSAWRDWKGADISISEHFFASAVRAARTEVGKPGLLGKLVERGPDWLS